MLLASLYSWADWFQYHFVRNSEDRICRDEAHIIASHHVIARSTVSGKYGPTRETPFEWLGVLWLTNRITLCIVRPSTINATCDIVVSSHVKARSAVDLDPALVYSVLLVEVSITILKCKISSAIWNFNLSLKRQEKKCIWKCRLLQSSAANNCLTLLTN